MTTITLFLAIRFFAAFQPFDTWEIKSNSSSEMITALKDCKARGEESGLWYRCEITRDPK